MSILGLISLQSPSSTGPNAKSIASFDRVDPLITQSRLALYSTAFYLVPVDVNRLDIGMSSSDEDVSGSEPAPPQSSHLLFDKGRTKKWAPKTFNGCLTCKCVDNGIESGSCN